MTKTILILAAGLPAVAHAGGILVGENGSQGMERAGAFVAKADDPTALTVNPAGLANTDHVAIYLGMNLLDFNLKYQRRVNQPIGTEPTSFPLATNGANLQPIPMISAVLKVQNLALAAGFWAPTSSPNRDFPCVNSVNCTIDAAGTPAPQRYDIVHQEVIIVYPSLAAAYRILPSLDVGVRASWGYASVKARNFVWATANHAEDPGFDGDFSASVTDSMVWNFGAGILFRPTSFLELGASASSGGNVRAKGTGIAILGDKLPSLPGSGPEHIEPLPDADAKCATGGTAAALKTCINFSLPRKAELGGRVILRDANGGERADLELDGRWEQYNRDADIEVIVDGQDSLLQRPLRPTLIRHGFQDVWSARLGGAYKIDLSADAVTVRGGVAFDTAAAPDSWTRLDVDTRPRQYVSLGAALDIPGWRFDAGISYVHEGTTTVTRVANPNPTFDNRSQPDPPQPAFFEDQQTWHPINEGTYDSGYIVGSFGITAMF